MAMKSRVPLLTLCFAFLISHGLAQNPPSISPTNSNFDDNQESVMECWSALFDLGWCYGDVVRAAQSGKVDLSIQPTCCKAAKSMNSGCWPKVFPYNPFFPQAIEAYCLRFPSAPPPPSEAGSRTPDLKAPSVASPTPASTDAVTPKAEGPSMASPTPVNANEPAPNAEGPVPLAPYALPPFAPSPINEGLFMDTPRDHDQGPIGKPWIHF